MSAIEESSLVGQAKQLASVPITHKRLIIETSVTSLSPDSTDKLEKTFVRHLDQLILSRSEPDGF